MKKILFYGNCQLEILSAVFEKNIKDWNCTYIFCKSTKIGQQDFNSIIADSDLIITQPIKDNYNNKDYLSTSYLLKSCRKDSKVIIFPSLQFRGYHIDLIHISRYEPPLKMHYEKLIEAYNKGFSVEQYIHDYVINQNLLSVNELNKIASDSIAKLQHKEADMLRYQKMHSNIDFVNVANYIEKNYQDFLLFYSIGHPTKYIYQLVCEKILEILNIKNGLDYEGIKFNHVNRQIIYQCVQKVVNFDISQHTPRIETLNCDDMQEILQLYYAAYDKNNPIL